MQGSLAECCEHHVEHTVSKKCGKYLYHLNDCYLLKKDSTPWNQLVSLEEQNQESEKCQEKIITSWLPTGCALMCGELN